MRRLLKRFASDNSGATAIEYALIAGTIALGIVSTLSLLAPSLNEIFGEVTTLLD